MTDRRNALSKWLDEAPQWVFVLFAIVTSFCTYFCMYAFRKPFAVAQFEGMTFLHEDLQLKTVFVISQILGYTTSKYIGIKLCSEITRGWRAFALVAMILIAEFALFLFAVLPVPLKVLAIFLNGLPLGMVWGLVVWYLEGRRTSEILLAGLSCSFIVSSGMVKSVGSWLMEGYAVSPFWMPFWTGAIFLLPFFFFVWLLNQLPQPSESDVEERVEREPMYAEERTSFVKEFMVGLIMLFIAYFFLTAYRDIRDNYQAEIFQAIGYGGEPEIFTLTELPVAFLVMGALAGLNLIRNNKLGLIGAYGIMTFGVALLGFGTLLFDYGIIQDGAVWMVLTGLGSYLAYVPYGSVLFDRTIASTRVVGTAVFAIYLADAIGYTGSVGVQLYQNFFYAGTVTAADVAGDKVTVSLVWLNFFRHYTYFMSILGLVLLISSCIYFMNKIRKHENERKAKGDPKLQEEPQDMQN